MYKNSKYLKILFVLIILIIFYFIFDFLILKLAHEYRYTDFGSFATNKFLLIHLLINNFIKNVLVCTLISFVFLNSFIEIKNMNKKKLIYSLIITLFIYIVFIINAVYNAMYVGNIFSTLELYISIATAILISFLLKLKIFIYEKNKKI